jgi:predicted DNA-binding transcriptional regulator AlpA
MAIQNLSTLLSTAQVAAHLGIKPRTVLAWVQQGRLPQPLRIGKAPQWEMQELSKTIDVARARRDEAANEPKPRISPPISIASKGYASSKELQMMLAFRRAQLGRAGATASSTRRPH